MIQKHRAEEPIQLTDLFPANLLVPVHPTFTLYYYIEHRYYIEYRPPNLFRLCYFEKAIANAAVGYLNKWKTGTTDAARAHAIGEAVGFIYSLRFAEMHGADASFSDEILKDFLETGSGFWELDAETINGALEAIATKFDL